MPLKYKTQNIHTRVFQGNGNLQGSLQSDFMCLPGQRFSFQLPIQFLNEKTDSHNTECQIVHVSLTAEDLDGVNIRIRRLGFVPIAHHTEEVSEEVIDCVSNIPGLIADPLYDEQDIILKAGETGAFWLTLNISANCSPGRKVIKLTLFSKYGDRKTRKDEIAIKLSVQEQVLEKRRNFPVMQWFYNDAIADWYKLDLWSSSYWNILQSYTENLTEHGQDGILVPLFTPPTDGVKRPTQLLRVSKNGNDYSFDWSDVEKYLSIAKSSGINFLEWNHLFTQWGVKNAIRIYEGQGKDESKLLWPIETSATSPVYKNFLSKLLPEFHNFLLHNKILEKSFFHVSDEPNKEHLNNYQQARTMLKELAPWMKTMDALSDVSFAKKGLTDFPVPGTDHIMDFIKNDIESWVYFCCAQRGKSINRFLDTPLIRQRMLGWLCYHFQCKGFLHWGYNYWYKQLTRKLIDPFTDASAGNWPKIPYGDPFIVYPGPDGPLDSIRWEIFAESMQDYALLQTLNIDPDDDIFSGFNNFSDFPANEKWLQATRKKLFCWI